MENKTKIITILKEQRKELIKLNKVFDKQHRDSKKINSDLREIADALPKMLKELSDGLDGLMKQMIELSKQRQE